MLRHRWVDVRKTSIGQLRIFGAYNIWQTFIAKKYFCISIDLVFVLYGHKY